MDREKLMKMASAVRTGGKGSMRRKKKAVHKTTTTDDKRLQSTLKRIGVNAIPAIEEVNIFKDDFVIQFQNPKVQASIAANTWVIGGSPQTKRLQDVLPSILNQLGPDNLDNLRKLAEHFQKQAPGGGATTAQDDDDDVPELVEGQTFEEAAADETPAAAPQTTEEATAQEPPVAAAPQTTEEATAQEPPVAAAPPTTEEATAQEPPVAAAAATPGTEAAAAAAATTETPAS